MARSFTVFAVAVVTIGLSFSCAKKTPEEKFQDAVDALQKRDPLGAIILAHEILRENTSGTLALRARWLLFECYALDRNFKECGRVLNEVIDQAGLDSDDGQQAARYKIDIYAATRQTTAALEQTRSFLEGATTGTAFWGELMLRVGDHLRAVDQATTAQEVFAQVLNNNEVPEAFHFGALERLTATYATTDSASAGIEFFENYLADKPSTDIVPNVCMIMGHLATVLDEKDRAENLFSKGFAAFEQMYEEATGADRKIAVLIRYARAYNFKGDLEQTVALLQKGLKEFPTSPMRLRLFYELAAAYANNEKYDRAIEVYREIPAQFPNHNGRLEAYFLAAECHRLQNNYDEAVKDYQEIMALLPGTQWAQRAYQEIRRTELLRRKEAETSATLALRAAQATSPTATLTTATAVTTAPVPAGPPSPPTPPERDEPATPSADLVAPQTSGKTTATLPAR